MPSLFDLVLALILLVGPDGSLIEQQLDAAPRVALAEVGKSSRRLWLVFHQREDWPRAFYARPELRLSAGAEANLGLGPRATLPVPRLFLYKPYYLDAGRLRPLQAMAVDVADIYLVAIFEGYLDHQLRLRSPYGVELATRAKEWLDDVPTDQRVDALVGSLADFGAHLTKVALQIEQLAVRRSSPAELCPLVRQRVALFGAWQRNFGDGGFPIQYRRSEPGAEVWVTSSVKLLESDKRDLIARVLGGHWSGDPESDFSWLCANENRQ